MISAFGVSANRANWAVAGWSMGGTCALDLVVMHPDLFSAFVDIAGDLGTNTGTKSQTIAQLFGGNLDAWASIDPTTAMTRHGPYTGVSGLFIFPGHPRNKNRDAAHNPENQDLAANSLCMLATTKGIRCAAVAQPGRHDWPYAATEFAAALPWLAGQLDSPPRRTFRCRSQAQRRPVPQSGPRPPDDSRLPQKRPTPTGPASPGP